MLRNWKWISWTKSQHRQECVPDEDKRGCDMIWRIHPCRRWRRWRGDAIGFDSVGAWDWWWIGGVLFSIVRHRSLRRLVGAGGVSFVGFQHWWVCPFITGVAWRWSLMIRGGGWCWFACSWCFSCPPCPRLKWAGQRHRWRCWCLWLLWLSAEVGAVLWGAFFGRREAWFVVVVIAVVIINVIVRLFMILIHLEK